MAIKHYFLDGNNSQGYTTLLKYVVGSMENIYMVKGSIKSNKTALFKQISRFFEEDTVVQWLHNPSDEVQLDGIIIPEKSLAIIDGSGRNGFEEKYRHFVKKIFDLDESLDKSKLMTHKNTLLALQNKYEELHEEAYQRFSKGREIHERKEELYIAAMDFDKANKVIAQLAANLFHDISLQVEKPLVSHLFFGAATPNGAINYIENITNDISKRYIIKGRSGSGKSTLMRKIAKYGENLGLSIQYFPCGLDRNSLDMIIIPSLSVAILDGTAPHVIDPTRASDEVIDMFELCMDQSVEGVYKKQFDQLHLQYKQEMIAGTACLKEASDVYRAIEDYYLIAQSTSKLDQILSEIRKNFAK